MKIDGMENFGVVRQDAHSVALCLPIPPSANRYWRMAKNRMIVSEEAQQYKWQVALLCNQLSPFAGDVRLRVEVYRARKSGDLDNYLKCLLDSLRGIVYPDDKAVVEIHAKRKDDKHNPRVLLLAYIGDNDE